LPKVSDPGQVHQHPPKLNHFHTQTSSFQRAKVLSLDKSRQQQFHDLTVRVLFELLGRVAGLPSTTPDDDRDAEQFDLLILRLQLTLLRGAA
jgi:type I site-specific restriction endonuclease